jgi:hypothetical protein
MTSLVEHNSEKTFRALRCHALLLLLLLEAVLLTRPLQHHSLMLLLQIQP